MYSVTIAPSVNMPTKAAIAIAAQKKLRISNVMWQKVLSLSDLLKEVGPISVFDLVVASSETETSSYSHCNNF